MVGQPAVRLLLQTQKVRNDPPAIGAGGFSYFVKVRMITYLHITRIFLYSQELVLIEYDSFL